MSSPFTLLGGELRYSDVPSEFEIDITASDGNLYRVPFEQREVVGRMAIYLKDDDLVREVNLRGLLVSFVQWEPTPEDRLQVAGHEVAGLLAEEGLDVHDFKTIAYMALVGLERNGLANSELSQQLDRIHYKLGGLD